MRSVGSHRTSGREKEGKKERTGCRVFGPMEMLYMDMVFTSLILARSCAVSSADPCILLITFQVKRVNCVRFPKIGPEKLTQLGGMT